MPYPGVVFGQQFPPMVVVSAECEGDLTPLSVTIHCVCPSALVGLFVEHPGVGLLDVQCGGIMPLAVIGRTDLYKLVAVDVHHAVSSEGSYQALK